MKYTFEPYREDGSPRKFVGLFRPPYADVLPDYLPTYHEKHHLKSWTLGRFDKPLYEDTSDSQEG